MHKFLITILCLVCIGTAEELVATYYNVIKATEVTGVFRDVSVIRMDNGRTGTIDVQCMPIVGDTVVTRKYKVSKDKNSYGDNFWWEYTSSKNLVQKI